VPDRLIDLPAVRDPSPGLLHRLRAIDWRAEALYVGEGRWWVGRVKTDSARRPVGRRMVVAIQAGDGLPNEPGTPSDRWPELRQALLMAQGFGLVCDVTVQGEPDARLVGEFELAMYVERGGQFVSDEERAWESRHRDRIRENRIRDRELTKWLFSRHEYGRGNTWMSMHNERRFA
jgi:hypothetical protein